MSLAAKAEGRTISAYINIRLIPPPAPLGEVDIATEIGLGLIREAALLLKTAGEREGFTVHVTGTNIVY